MPSPQTSAAEARFSHVFAQFGAVSAYARRRGCPDPEALAAETMAIAWRRLADVPRDDPRPWLLATARNLVLADWRSRARSAAPQARDADPDRDGEPSDRAGPAHLAEEIDPALAAALLSLSLADREALLLVAWEDLTPKQAAASLGITATAFRVRLHRARRRCRDALQRAPSRQPPPAAQSTPNHTTAITLEKS